MNYTAVQVDLYSLPQELVDELGLRDDGEAQVTLQYADDATILVGGHDLYSDHPYFDELNYIINDKLEKYGDQ